MYVLSRFSLGGNGPYPPPFGGHSAIQGQQFYIFLFVSPVASKRTRPVRYREIKGDTPEQRLAQHPVRLQLAGWRLFPRLPAAPKSPPEPSPHPARGTHNPAIFP